MCGRYTMPPKKIVKGSKDKKGGKERSHNGLNEQKKVAYIVEIQELEKRLNRYQTKHDDILSTNVNFQDQLNKMVMEQREAVSFFGKELQRRVEEIADLNDQLVGLQQTKDVEKEQQENELHDRRTEFKETKDQLLANHSSFVVELGLLDEYRIHKEDFINRNKMLEVQLAQLKELHQQKDEHLDWKEAHDRDVLKAQMGNRINQVAAGFRQSSNAEMAETTKRAIRENVSIQEQVDKMNDKSSELLVENEELRERTKNGRKQIAAMKSKSEMLTKNYVSSNKVIAMLKEEAAAQSQQLVELGLRDEQCCQRQIEADVILNKRSKNEGERSDLIEEIQTLKVRLHEVRQSNEEVDTAINRLKKVLTVAASMLHRAVRTGSAKRRDKKKVESQMQSNVLTNILFLLEHRESVEFLADSVSADDIGNSQNKLSDKDGKYWPQSNRSDEVFPVNSSVRDSSPNECRTSTWSARDRNDGRSSTVSSRDSRNPPTKSGATQTVAVQKGALFLCNKVVESMSLADCEEVLQHSREFLQENLLPPIESKRSSNVRQF